MASTSPLFLNHPSPSTSSNSPSPSTSPWRYSAPPVNNAYQGGYGPSTSNDLQVPKKVPARPYYRRSMTSVPSGYMSRHGKLHKRSGSGSSLLSSNPTMSFANNADYYHPYTGAPVRKNSATLKIKPYLRKMTLLDDDEEQGRIDLSRPSGEHDTLSGLGFADIGEISPSASDVSFIPAVGRRSSHRRATSLSSPFSMSTNPTGLRQSQSFVQPVRRTSQSPITPSIFANAPCPPSEDEAEAEESVDILTDDLRRTSIERWRSRRTISSGSVPHASTYLPTQNYSAGSLTRLANASQSNLSTASVNSNKSGPEIKKILPRRTTSLSGDIGGTTPSSRTSIDRAVSFLSRTSEPEEPASRAANIRAARRAFEEKEAAKERKLEKMEAKRRDTAEMKRTKKQERQRRKSDTSTNENNIRRRKSTNTRTAEDMTLDEKLAGTEYSRHVPVPSLSLPIQGGESGAAEARIHTEISKTKAAKGHWVRFRAWSKTRMLSCY